VFGGFVFVVVFFGRVSASRVGAWFFDASFLVSFC
jgi:hypothetical protein